MKKKLFYTFVFVAILSPALTENAEAQNRITEVKYSDKIQKTIVREYIYPATVSYIETVDSHFFAYADESMTVINATIDQSIYVLDFVIHDSRVYFCGYQTGQTARGIWGWFEIASFMNGSVDYYIYDDFKCDPQFVDTLYSLAVHEENSEFHIAVTGANTDGAAKRRWCLIDITGRQGFLTGWQYEMGIPFGINTVYDRLTHVCVTDNYVVAAGTKEPAYASESYRIHDRTNMFGGGIENHFYLYPPHNNGYWHDSLRFVMTPVTGDMIAVANKAYSNATNSILVNVYDMALTVGAMGISPVYTLNVQNINAIDGFRLRDIRYSTSQSELHLLLSGTQLPTNQTGSILAEIPLPPTPPMIFYQIDNCILLSLDNYNSQNTSLALGYDYVTPSKLNYFTKTLLSNTQCANSSQFQCVSDGYSSKYEWSPYTVCREKFDCKIIHGDVLAPKVNNINCTSR